MEPYEETLEMLRNILECLIDQPKDLQIEASVSDQNAVFRVTVSPEDLGKVIGKQGRTARSIRTILGAASMKHGRRYTLDIIEPDDMAGDGEIAAA